MATKKEIEAKQKAALAEIETHVETAYAALKRATVLADENGVTFDFSPAYGMGGYYHPTKSKNVLGAATDVVIEDENDDWESSDEGWVSSSNNC